MHVETQLIASPQPPKHLIINILKIHLITSILFYIKNPFKTTANNGNSPPSHLILYTYIKTQPIMYFHKIQIQILSHTKGNS